MNILKEKETPLLSRKRITLEIDYDGSTPSSEQIVSELSKKASVEEKLVELRHIYNKFGKSKAKVIAHVYNDANAMSKIIKLGKKAKEKLAKTEEDKKKVEESKVEEPAKEEAKPEEESKVEEPAKEEAKPEEESKVEEPAKEETKGE